MLELSKKSNPDVSSEELSGMPRVLDQDAESLERQRTRENPKAKANRQAVKVTVYIQAELYLELCMAASECHQTVQSFISECAEAVAAQRRATRFGFPQAKYTLTARPRRVVGPERTLHKKKVYLPGVKKDLTNG